MQNTKKSDGKKAVTARLWFMEAVSGSDSTPEGWFYSYSIEAHPNDPYTLAIADQPVAMSENSQKV